MVDDGNICDRVLLVFERRGSEALRWVTRILDGNVKGNLRDNFVLGVSRQADLVSDRVYADFAHIFRVESCELILFVQESFNTERTQYRIVIQEHNLVRTALGIRLLFNYILIEPFLNQRWIS